MVGRFNFLNDLDKTSLGSVTRYNADTDRMHFKILAPNDKEDQNVSIHAILH